MNKLAILVSLFCIPCFQTYCDDYTLEDMKNTSVAETAVEGIGLIRVGETIIHKKYGRGQLTRIDRMSYETDSIIFAMIEFDDQVRTMLISSEHFEPVK